MDKHAPLSVYAWDRCFLLQAQSFALTKHSKPYRRPSATVIVANGKPFVLKTNHGVRRQYQGVIVAPYVLRQSIIAEDSDISIVDAGIGSEAYRRLQPRLAPQQVADLSPVELGRIKTLLQNRNPATTACAEARRVFDGIIDAVSPPGAQVPPLDQNVAQLLGSFEEGGSPQAELAKLSDARLRTLFAETIGCSPQQYRNWLNTWKAVAGWKPGLSLEKLARLAGIDNPEEIEQTMNNLFGMSPEILFGSERVHFNNCNG